ncbi:MAG: endonuclease/exonuclease/phosphatase family protein [Bacteroidota bacterium]
MRLFSLLLALLLMAPAAHAQTLPPQGADLTFEVATWNIENFGTGSGGTAQRQAAAEIIRQADVDLWALQEIVDRTDFDALLQELSPDGYVGFLGPTPSLGGSQRLAYIYKENVVSVIAITTILSSEEFEFAYRLPLEMRASVTVGGETESIRIINFHAKCCSDQQSYERRTDAAIALKAYTDRYVLEERPVIVLGDFNDELNISISSGFSPYRPYRNDPDYTVATREIDRVGVPTFCGNSSCTSGSTLDHILFSNDLGATYLVDEDPRFEEVIAEFSNYPNTVSDHLPVIARFTLVPVANEAVPDAELAFSVAPNPAKASATVRFGLAAPTEVRLTVQDALGRRVITEAVRLGAGEHALPVGTGDLAPGVYVVRLEADGVVATRTLVRAR